MGTTAQRGGPLLNEDADDGAMPSPSDRRISDAVHWLMTVTADHALPNRGDRVLVTALGGTPQSFALAVAREVASAYHAWPQSETNTQTPAGAVVIRPVSGTLLVDTSQGAASLSPLIQVARSPGLAELCQFRARFEDVIQRDMGSRLHFLGAGKPRTVGGAWGDPGVVDRIFRALDASYRYLLFCAELPEALLLAENLKRQFCAAILADFTNGREERPVAMLGGYGFPVLIVRINM
jgi:hypothetical protein